MSQFVRFSIVGTVGYCCDVVFVIVLRPYLGLTAAALISYFTVASLNWLLNHLWTFRLARRQHAVLQWLRYLAANSLGFLLNRGSVYFMCLLSAYSAQHVALPLAVGALVGLGANFSLSRKLVFRSHAPDSLLELAQMTLDPCHSSSHKDLNS